MAVMQVVGTWLGRVGALIAGEFVVREKVHFPSRVVEKTFKNGLYVVQHPGGGHVGVVPTRWLTGQDRLLTKLREGSWVKTEKWTAATGVVEKTFRNGVRVVQAPGRPPVARLPQRLLAKDVGRI